MMGESVDFKRAVGKKISGCKLRILPLRCGSRFRQWDRRKI